MRNLFMLSAAVAGAVLAAGWSIRFGSALAPYQGGGPNPMSLLLMVPAVMVGALVGAIVGGMLAPRAR